MTRAHAADHLAAAARRIDAAADCSTGHLYQRIMEIADDVADLLADLTDPPPADRRPFRPVVDTGDLAEYQHRRGEDQRERERA